MRHFGVGLATWVVWASAVVGCAGCASEDAAPSAKDGGTLDGALGDGSAEDAASGAAVFGYFNVKITPMKPATLLRAAMPDQVGVIGAFGASPTPDPFPWVVELEEGDCRLLLPRHPLCDPACTGGAMCVADELGETACIPQPEAADVGTLQVTGLGEPFEIERAGRSYQPVGIELAFPPCEDGEPIEIAAEGGAFDAFELRSTCVAPMVFPGPVAIERGMPLQLTWEPPSDPELTRVQVHFDISHHGGARGLIDCDLEDDGSHAIPAALVDGLVDLGVSGFPTLVLTRSAVAHGSTSQSEAVVLTVSSSFDNLVEIEGLTSCTSDEHCEGDATCQPDFRCE